MPNRPVQLEVVARPLLVNGMLWHRDGRFIVLVDSESTQEEQIKSLWHEIVHMLRACGGESDQDEEAVEAAAHKLAQCCPEIIEWLGLHLMKD